jgi:hypothetical protein
MTDPFSLATGVAGLVSLALQVTSISYWYVRSVHGASESWKEIIEESKILRDLLTDLQVNLLDDDDLVEAFSNRASSVITRLGDPTSSMTASLSSMMIDPSTVAIEPVTTTPPSQSYHRSVLQGSQGIYSESREKKRGQYTKAWVVQVDKPTHRGRPSSYSWHV